MGLGSCVGYLPCKQSKAKGVQDGRSKRTRPGAVAVNCYPADDGKQVLGGHTPGRRGSFS